MQWLRGMFDRGKFKPAGIETNPEALSALAQASETYAIVASQDIVDMRGRKLWNRGQRVTPALQQRLQDRGLQQPLEVCLSVEDGVTVHSLHQHLKTYFEEDSPLAMSLRPWAPVVLQQVQELPLHPVAQLLLTTALATRPKTLPHAIQAMALAGAMSDRQDSTLDIRLAMLGGLLHDIGEVYVQPHHLEHDGPLNLMGHKHLVMHPRIAQLLLGTTTDYPDALCRAIGEHHGRLDGSGYPARLGEDNISSLGRMLSVVEVTLGIMRKPHAQLARASFALRVIPGEFDPQWADLVDNFARNADEAPPNKPARSKAAMCMETLFQQALDLNADLMAQGRTGLVLEVVSIALERLDYLRNTWRDSGFAALDSDLLEAQERFELEMATKEFKKHVRQLQRECMLLGERLTVAERVLIQPLWHGLLARQ